MGNEIHKVMFCSNKLMVEARETIFRDAYIKEIQLAHDSLNSCDSFLGKDPVGAYFH